MPPPPAAAAPVARARGRTAACCDTALQPALSCPGCAIASRCTRQAVPCRLLQVGWRIDVMPPGVRYAAHEPCPGCARPSFSNRLPFAGLTGIGGDIWVDGMNSEGLTAAYLWLDTHPFELNHRQARCDWAAGRTGWGRVRRRARAEGHAAVLQPRSLLRVGLELGSVSPPRPSAMHTAADRLCSRCHTPLPHATAASAGPCRSSSAPGAPMAWLDVVPYMLGRFSTVREAVAWATSDEVQVRAAARLDQTGGAGALPACNRARGGREPGGGVVCGPPSTRLMPKPNTAKCRPQLRTRPAPPCHRSQQTCRLASPTWSACCARWASAAPRRAGLPGLQRARR